MARDVEFNIGVNTKSATENVKTLDESIQSVGTSVKSAKQELRELNTLISSGALTGENLDQAITRAGQLRDTIQDANASINATAGNATENLGKGLGSMAQIGIQGFQGILGAAALFGVESENLQKTMVMLQGAMALTSSIEFFGGIEDRVNNIGKSFTSLGEILGIVKTQQTAAAVSAGALAAGETAAGTAAGAAVAPTTALGMAMKALPIVAIIAGLVALIAVISDYVGKNNQAAREEKKRVKIAEEQQKLTGAATQKMNDEIGKFGALIGMLKQTNAGSKERSSLISEINSKYGTTLKNLKDEKMFQDQLNNSVINFIALQKARYKQEVGEETLKKLFKEEELLKGQLKTAEDIDKKEKKRQMTTDNYMGSFEKQNKMNEDRIKANQAALDKNLKAQEALSKETLTAYTNEKEALNKLGIKEGKDGGKSGGNHGQALDKQNEILEKRRKLLDEINSRLEREEDAERQLAQLNTDREEIGEDVYILKTKQETEINKLILANQEFRDKVIEKATERELNALEEKFVNGTMTEQQYVEQIEIIRQKGADNLLPIEEELLSRKTDLMNDEINKIKDVAEQKRVIEKRSADLTYLELAQSQVQFDKQNTLREIESSNKTEEEKRKLRLETLKYYADTEISQIQQIAEQNKKILEAKYDEELKLAKENNESTENINAKYQSDSVKIEQDAANKIADIRLQLQEKTEQGFAATLTKVQEGLELYGQAALSIFSGINDLLKQQTENQIRDVNARYETEMHQLKALYDQKELSEEEFNAQSIALQQQRDQEERILRRKQFERDKKYSLVSAIMSGAQAITSALATVPFVPAGLVAAATAAISTGIQIATINAQQFTAARGGIVPGNGPNNIDSVPSLLAPGEAVINANSAAMFPNTLSLINQAGGGVALAPELPQQGSSGSGTIFMENKQQPLKAYVVETEITDSQKRINRIQRSVEF